jgi:putative VirB-like lipoprotein
MNRLLVGLLAVLALSGCSPRETVFDGFGDAAQKLRVVNRKATKLSERNGVRLSDASGNGVAWIEGSDFRTGTIEIDIRGQESLGQSFVGVAFHRKSDDSYEAVYLRPFNFRAADPARRQHAVQYISLPDYDWPRLREAFPEQFENPVDESLDPTGWVRLRVAIDAHKLQIFVGPVTQPTLEVRKLGELDGGQVGLWVGNVSGGDFANLVITPAK